ncbi:hypothetical protein [Natronobeatus ordinarius]|uniref:hypothetical protein n=1 Tax=Natronobeatus ordinarius TaxID=2963433 RepID=UPI0020CBDF6A|nr:hypothetical protein [Natronobeatus ordinarius]
MPSTRRRFLAGSTATITLLSGCTAFGGDAVTVRELEVELANETNARHVFHFAVETTDGLEAWESHEVAPGTSESTVSEPPADAEPVAIHGVVDDQPTRYELLGTDGESGEHCLRVVFEYGLGDAPTFLESADVRCS